MTIVDMSSIVVGPNFSSARFKLGRSLPIGMRMSISSVASAAATSPEAQEVERSAAVMRKARDIQQSQAESLLALVKSARPEGVGQNISVHG